MFVGVGDVGSGVGSLVEEDYYLLISQFGPWGQDKGHTSANMILVRIRLSNNLVQSLGRTRIQPQERPYVNVIKRPERRMLSKQGMDVSRVEQACTGIVQGHSQFTTGLPTQDGEKDRAEVSLFVVCSIVSSPRTLCLMACKWR